MNEYDVLGVPQDADMKTIRRRYRGLILMYHPDRNDTNTSKKLNEIIRAYKKNNFKQYE